VLQTYRYSDTSKILRLMTLEHGPRSAVARGALRPKSRFGGLLELFCEGDATLYLREQRDLHTLSGFELVRERRALGSDMGRFSGASVMCELVMRLAPEHRDDRLYHALTAGLDALLDATPERSVAVALSHVWQLVRVLGFAPDLGSCLQCGRSISDGEEARFDFTAGGLRCGDCALLGRPLKANELAILRALVKGEEPPDRLEGPQSRLVADFVRYHLAEGSRLQSLNFLLESS
jgi:DNA repair protein RecO (recombination protein O)